MRSTRRQFVGLAGATGAAALFGGCDAVNEELARLLDAAPEADFRPPERDEIDLVAHVLDRITWGAAPGDYRRVERLGVDAFIEEQLDAAAIRDRGADRRVASLSSLAEPAGELYDYDAGQLLLDLSRYKVLRAVYSRRQLHEVMVDFWTDHLNIVSEKGDCRWLKAADDRDVVRVHALGRFRDLVRASATSPAMLIYLDGHDNKVEAPGERPNENYARELLELHTLGVHGGYTQGDVAEVARCLSGWTYQNRPFKFKAAHVAFDHARHDDGVKHVLGETIPAGGGDEDLERVLDIVCTHPSTARHVGGKLCRRFIDEPAPPAAVAAVADAFLETGGDIRTTLRALFATNEFRSTRGTLFKRPFRFMVSAIRATGARTNAAPPMIEYLERMGHAPFQYPTPDGYPIEPQPWLGTLLWRWNFALALQNGSLEGTTLDVGTLVARLGGAGGLAAHLLGRTPGAAETAVLQASGSPLALLLASPAFQRH